MKKNILIIFKDMSTQAVYFVNPVPGKLSEDQLKLVSNHDSRNS